MNRLDALLLDMDIPAIRRDTNKPENLRWMARNLAINNQGHPNLDAVLDEIKRAQRDPDIVIAPWEQAR